MTLTRTDTPPVCDVEMSQTTYIDGETVAISTWVVSNPGALPVATELKMWARIGDDIPFGLSSIGADGSLVIGAGDSIDVGSLPLFTVTTAIPVSSGRSDVASSIPPRARSAGWIWPRSSSIPESLNPGLRGLVLQTESLEADFELLQHHVGECLVEFLTRGLGQVDTLPGRVVHALGGRSPTRLLVDRV
jgi:hypothetical protein